MMTPDQYQTAAARTLNGEPLNLTGVQTAMLTCALGLGGEAGEAVDIVKKHIFHGHPLDHAKLLKELGDVLWYVSCLAYAADLRLEDIMRENIDKLKRRYPDGFSHEASRNRKD